METLAAQLPDDGRVALEWARTLHGYADAPAPALAAVERAVSLAPGLHGARLERALLQLKLGRPREALADLDALLTSGMRHPELLHVHRAHALEALGAVADALEAWKAAIRCGRPSAWLHWQHGRAAWRAGRLREAADALSEATSIGARAGEAPDPELLLDLSEVWLGLGERDAGRRTIEEAAAALWPEELQLQERLTALSERLRASQP